MYIDDGLSTRPNSEAMLATDVQIAGVATCRHEATNARVVVSIFAKGFELNAIGARKVAAEVAYRKIKNGKRRLASKELKTSDFLRQLKASQASGVLPFVASTIMALGSAAAMAL